MTRWTRVLPALAVALVLGACGQGTTDTPLSPNVARYEDGGGTSLGGNTVDPNAGGGSASTTSTTTAQSDSLGATGGTSLGGN